MDFIEITDKESKEKVLKVIGLKMLKGNKLIKKTVVLTLNLVNKI